MCGITGAIWTKPEHALDRASLGRMTEAIRHRGPDDSGEYTSDLRIEKPYPDTPGVALGFRRLSIIDLEGSHQPLSNEDGSIWIVFNGEIYNYADLRRRLQGNGHTFATDGDTETIVHLYEDEGLGFLQHLVGMFALAIWDSNKRRLILARDRIGQKPLVYKYEPGRLLFASEIKSLLQAPNVAKEIDPNAIDEYLTYQYIPHPNTIFRGIRKLPPGHVAVFENDELKISPYWQPDFNSEKPLPQGEHVAKLKELVTDSVRLRLRSDVPLGVFLSGGIDSSIMAAIAQDLSDEPINTFSIGFNVKEYDESAAARATADFLGTNHRELRVDPSGLDILPKLVWYYDEPFGDSSAIPTFHLAELTREHVTVAISGDGGDELYAGYRRYRAVKMAERFDKLPGGLNKLIANSFWQKIPSSQKQHSRVRLFKRFCEALAMPRERRYADWVGIFGHKQRAQLYTDNFFEQLTDSDPFSFLEQAFRKVDRRDAVTAASLVDLMSYLPCDLCTKVDIASMANSLECRQPLLDHRVVEHAIGMPLSEKQRGGKVKRVFQDAFRDMVPAGSLHAAKTRVRGAARLLVPG